MYEQYSWTNVRSLTVNNEILLNNLCDEGVSSQSFCWFQTTLRIESNLSGLKMLCHPLMYYDVVLPVNLSEINTMQLQHLHLVTPEPSRTDIVFYIIV